MEEATTLDVLETENAVYFSKPSLPIRIKSMMVDVVVVIGLMMIASKILTAMSIESGVVRGVVLGLIILYEPLFVSIDRTLGQKIMGLRVRNFSSVKQGEAPENINFFLSIWRFIMKSLLGWISLLTIHSNDYGKAIHDSLANSVMTLEK